MGVGLPLSAAHDDGALPGAFIKVIHYEALIENHRRAPPRFLNLSKFKQRDYLLALLSRMMRSPMLYSFLSAMRLRSSTGSVLLSICFCTSPASVFVPPASNPALLAASLSAPPRVEERDGQVAFVFTDPPQVFEAGAGGVGKRLVGFQVGVDVGVADAQGFFVG